MSRGDADSPQADGLADRSPDQAMDTLAPLRSALSGTPPLSFLAAGAAFVHVLLYRLLLPLLASKKLTLPMLLLVGAPFALNLAVCAGLVALIASGWDLVRAKDLTYTARRILIAGLSGLLISTIGLATFCPEGQLSGRQVLLAVGALHTMVVQIAMAALRAQRSLSGRTTASLIAAASLFPLSSLILRHWEPLADSPIAHEGVASLHGLGELAYLLVPIAAAFVVLPWGDDGPSRAARRAGAVAVCVMAVVFGAAARMPDALYGHILYSTLRLEWALERASLGYAVPVSLAAGAAMAATWSRDSRHRQGGAGLWLWLAGGYNPLTPARLLMAALGAMLLCRAIVSLGGEAISKTERA